MSVPLISIVRFSAPVADRPLLVLGPSLGTSVETLWAPCAALLADRFEVVGWDLPGHGLSAPAEAPFSIADLADGVLAAVGDRAFDYAGDSIGGAVGLTLLIERPDRIQHAVLACTGASIGTPEGWLDRSTLVRAEGTGAVVDSSAARWFGPGFTHREPGLAYRLLAGLRTTDDESYALACEALGGYDVHQRLRHITAPLTLIGGMHDQVTPTSAMREIARVVPGSRLVELDAGHLLPAEEPAAVAALIGAARPADHVPTSQDVDDPRRTQVRAAGLSVRRAVAGSQWVERAQANTTEFTQDFQDLITEYAWGTIWTRPGLDRRSRSMITLTALIARGHHEELAMHVRAALTNGLTREEIKEVLLQSAIYCGVPDANSAFRIAVQVFRDIDGDAS